MGWQRIRARPTTLRTAFAGRPNYVTFLDDIRARASQPDKPPPEVRMDRTLRRMQRGEDGNEPP